MGDPGFGVPAWVVVELTEDGPMEVRWYLAESMDGEPLGVIVERVAVARR